jgi:hypothetical protein
MRKNDQIVPDFFIAGAPKCGTTSLHHALAQHPEISFGEEKEPQCLTRHDEIVPAMRRLRNGKLLFEPGAHEDIVRRAWESNWPNGAGPFLLGEATPRYIFSAIAAERMSRLAPNARVVFVLRHPVDRLWSAYRHHLRNQRVTSSFETSLENGVMRFVARQSYLGGLTQYYERFSSSSILVVLFEEWVQSRIEVESRIFEHLGLKPHLTEQQSFQNKGLKVYSPRAAELSNFLRQLSYAVGPADDGAPPGILARAAIKLSKIVGSRAYERSVFSRSPLQMERATRELLNEYFEAREHGLSELIGVDCKEWWGLDI